MPPAPRKVSSSGRRYYTRSLLARHSPAQQSLAMAPAGNGPSAAVHTSREAGYRGELVASATKPRGKTCRSPGLARAGFDPQRKPSSLALLGVPDPVKPAVLAQLERQPVPCTKVASPMAWDLEKTHLEIGGGPDRASCDP